MSLQNLHFVHKNTAYPCQPLESWILMFSLCAPTNPHAKNIFKKSTWGRILYQFSKSTPQPLVHLKQAQANRRWMRFWIWFMNCVHRRWFLEVILSHWCSQQSRPEDHGNLILVFRPCPSHAVISSFNDILNCRWWNPVVLCKFRLRNIILKLFTRWKTAMANYAWTPPYLYFTKTLWEVLFYTQSCY